MKLKLDMAAAALLGAAFGAAVVVGYGTYCLLFKQYPEPEPVPYDNRTPTPQPEGPRYPSQMSDDDPPPAEW